MTDTLATLDKRVESFYEEAIATAKQLAVGQDVIIKIGKFAGRRARVTMVTIDRNMVRYLAQPYRLDGKKEPYGENADLLWNDSEARNFSRYEQLHWIEYEGDPFDDYAID